MANPIVTFEMENGDIMKAELYPEIAPNTVNNFISLVQNGFCENSPLIVYPGPPMPVPSGHPPWIMNPRITLWKMSPS